LYASGSGLRRLEGLERLTTVRCLYLDRNQLPASELLRLPGERELPALAGAGAGPTSQAAGGGGAVAESAQALLMLLLLLPPAGAVLFSQGHVRLPSSAAPP
jgi:hypothetical protein